MRTPHHRRPTPQSGFSLLELMVAVSLLSLVVIPLLLSQGDAMRNAARLEERALAAMVAENILNEATAFESKAAGTERGKRKQGALDFNYRIKRKTERQIDPRIKLVKVTVDISRPGQRGTLASLVGYQREKK